MWRTRAVVTMLHEEVAALPRERADEGDRPSDGTPALERARRRGRLIVALDLAAIAILFFFRDRGMPFLSAGAGEETIFTLGVLAIAVHAGFRLGQLEKLSAVARLSEDLTGRVDEADDRR